jgi:hypothetical protein
MKLKIHKKTKKVLLLILILLIALSGLQLFLTITFPKKAVTETVLFESDLKPQLKYQVVINPNEVYSGTVLEEGKVYSKKLLNYIQTAFSLEYSGSKKVPLDIEYQIIATVNGFQGGETEKKIIWSKNFPLSTKKIIKEESATWSKSEKVNFQLSNYDAFAVRAKDITGMTVTNELIVSMTGKVTAHTAKEDLETPFNIGLTIPLMEDTFQITVNNLEPIHKNITTKAESQAPVEKSRLILYGFLLTICLLGLFILLFFTRELNPQELLIKKVNSTLKNYGSRIVALQNIPKMNYRQHYKVHSMKDLIKIADELQKPIFYEVSSSTIVKDYEFHIIEEETLYSLFLDSSEA